VHDGHLEGMRGNTDNGVCPVCGREEGGSHMLLCEGTRNWRDKWLERRFTRIYIYTYTFH
jgi:hypothetical protein